ADTACTTSPAATKAALQYHHLVRNSYGASTNAIFFTTSCRLRFEAQYVKSPWKVSKPNRWLRRSFRMAELPARGSLSLKYGSHFVTLSFSESFLSCSSIANAVAVNNFVLEPIMKRVLSLTGCFVDRSVTPY